MSGMKTLREYEIRFSVTAIADLRRGFQHRGRIIAVGEHPASSEDSLPPSRARPSSESSRLIEARDRLRAPRAHLCSWR